MLTEDLGLGGAETMALALAGALARDPSRRVVFAAGDGPLRARLDPAVAFHALPVYTPPAAPGLVLRLARLLKQERPDIVHSHAATVGVLAAAAAKLAGARPLRVLTHHSIIAARVPGALYTRALDLAFDRVIAISATKRDRLLAGGFPAAKLALIPNFVDCDAAARRLAAVDREAVRAELGLEPGRPAVLVASRLIPAKRVDRFIEILARCPGRPVGLVLGDGPERPRLEALAAARAADVRVVFLGYQSDIYKYLAVSSAFLFPSAHPEVLPMVLIESLAAGVPVVCSDIPGNNEIVESGRSGWLVSGDDAAYAARLGALLADEGERRRLSDGARAAARASFHETAVVARTAALYDAGRAA